MGATFKVGDRVKLVLYDSHDGDYDLRIGDIGVVLIAPRHFRELDGDSVPDLLLIEWPGVDMNHERNTSYLTAADVEPFDAGARRYTPAEACNAVRALFEGSDADGWAGLEALLDSLREYQRRQS